MAYNVELTAYVCSMLLVYCKSTFYTVCPALTQPLSPVCVCVSCEAGLPHEGGGARARVPQQGRQEEEEAGLPHPVLLQEKGGQRSQGGRRQMSNPPVHPQPHLVLTNGPTLYTLALTQ